MRRFAGLLIQGGPNRQGRLGRFGWGLEVEEGPIAFEVFHVSAVGEGHVGDQVHEALDNPQHGLCGVMLQKTGGAGNVHEKGCESPADGPASAGQIAIGETRQERFRSGQSG
jgi:hypothetical protein